MGILGQLIQQHSEGQRLLISITLNHPSFHHCLSHRNYHLLWKEAQLCVLNALQCYDPDITEGLL